MSTRMHVSHGMEKAYHAQVINLHYSNIFKNRNLHCDIQQLLQLNPTHQAKEYQHLALSILNTRRLSIMRLTHDQYIILSVLSLTVNYRNHRHLQHCLKRSLKRNQLTDKHSKTHFLSSFLLVKSRNNKLFTYCQRFQSRLVREDFEPE